VTRRDVLWAVSAVALLVWGLNLFAWLIRPVVLVRKDGALLYVGCVVDSTGTPRQTFYPVGLDR
jgi:hypothetical protein